MKGQVSTPSNIVDLMVEKLFERRNPKSCDTILEPGCGSGAFIKGIIDWCERRSVEVPNIVGVEDDPRLIEQARRSIGDREKIVLRRGNFLLEDLGSFDFTIGNPPYVRIEELAEPERQEYRRRYDTAVNRFDLYILFFEKALKSLKPFGRLVFITPEKYEYTLTTKALRKLMVKYHVEEIHHIREDAFKHFVTYPTITTINRESGELTRILHRDGTSSIVKLPEDGSRWISTIKGENELDASEITLGDICVRISCGVATGKDHVFVMPKNEIPEALKSYAHPTVSGRELTARGLETSSSMIIPYDESGLLPEDRLEKFMNWFSEYKNTLGSRSCVKKGNRKWYAFHENPPMTDILRPKILCKDIGKEPKFWFDKDGVIVPRHSVYYIVPKNSVRLADLLDYLNSEPVRKWFIANCQRAANDFVRLQSSVLKKLPVPAHLVRERS
jgi:adenine-specific DNA-methyltransferase